MFLLACHHVAGTHRSVLVTTAFAHADATLHGIRKAAFVSRIFEIGLPLRGIVMLAITQVLVPTEWSNDFPRVHFPVRIPDLFEFAERLDEFLAKHDRQQFAA